MASNAVARSQRRLLFALFHPLHWPRRLRRAFLMALPLAVTCWLALLAAAICCRVASGLWQPIARWWNAPRRYRRHYGYYGSCNHGDATATSIPGRHTGDSS